MKIIFYKYLTRFLSRYFGTPQFLILFVTNDCWMNCKHCFYNEEFRSGKNIDKKVLTLKELEKLVFSIDKILYLSITGGEPFIREDIADIVNLFTRNKKVRRYQMPTSGFETSIILEKTKQILDSNPRIPFRIHVSLDGNEEIHEKIRQRKGSYKNAIDTIIGLNEYKKVYSNFDVGIVTTICNMNQDIIEEIGEIAENVNGKGEWCINIIRGEPRDGKMTDIKVEKYMKADAIIEQRIKNGTYIGYTGHLAAKWLSAKNAVRRKIIYRILENKYSGGGCSAGSLSGVIYPDGSVYPCELINKSFGNLRDYGYDLPAIWNSKKADEIRNWIQSTKCICTHECNLSTNFLIQPQTWFKIIFQRLKQLNF